MEHWQVILFFFAVALVYASVGFGGGSSYLAILALYGFEMFDMRSTALLCNIAVVSGSVILYFRNRLVQVRRILPLVALSVPAAFLGGIVRISEVTFFILLACALLVAAVLMWFQPQVREGTIHQAGSLPMNTGIGGSIGFLAGMTGIGGGIFLSPLLHLLRWAEPQIIAATAAVFILANSIAGLAGQLSHPDFRFNWQLALPLLAAVVVGGQIGSRLGISYFRQITVKRVTAVLVAHVSIRIFMKYLEV